MNYLDVVFVFFLDLKMKTSYKFGRKRIALAGKFRFFGLILPVLLFLFIYSCSNNDDPLPLTNFGISKRLIIDNFEGEEFAVVANGTYSMMQAYSTSATDGTHLDFQLVADKFPVIMKDQENNEWNVFGIAVSGPRLGEQLKVMNSMIGFWFSFSAMFPRVTIYGEGNQTRFFSSSGSNDWLIDPNQVYTGAAKEGIPALTFPDFDLFSGNGASFVADNELVLTYFDGEIVRVYPHKIMDHHEIVNEQSKLGSAVVSYCPLTGTGSIWLSKVNNQILKFGVSGLLYNSNLILYDRETDSNWSQMRQQSVSGEFISTIPVIIPYVEMTWAGAKKLASTVKILSDNNSRGRDYNKYPYGDYRTNNERINYPLDFKDDRLPAKERVLAIIINNKAKAYRFEHFN